MQTMTARMIAPPSRLPSVPSAPAWAIVVTINGSEQWLPATNEQRARKAAATWLLNGMASAVRIERPHA